MAPDIRGLVFDLDGPLIDDRGSVAAAFRGRLPQLGLVFDEDLLTNPQHTPVYLRLVARQIMSSRIVVSGGGPIGYLELRTTS